MLEIYNTHQIPGTEMYPGSSQRQKSCSRMSNHESIGILAESTVPHQARGRVSEGVETGSMYVQYVQHIQVISSHFS